MRNSTLYRANLSSEKVAFLSELKSKAPDTHESIEPKAYKRLDKQKEKELDILWENFKLNVKEEKSPLVYLITGFIAGVLSVFALSAILGLCGMFDGQSSDSSLGQKKFEKNISANAKKTQIAVIPARSQNSENIQSPLSETYYVKEGDSMSSIVSRFYGKYDPVKVEKIKLTNNLTSEHKLSIGQKLIIPLD